jgi:hypothetical protein
VPSFSSGLSFSIFQKINATLPGEVCLRMDCPGALPCRGLFRPGWRSY